jgi:hypothetical protein
VNTGKFIDLVAKIEGLAVWWLFSGETREDTLGLE